jgi:hypothetical protein
LEYSQKTSEEIIHSSAVTNIDPSGAGMSHGDRVMADACAAKAVQFLGRAPKRGEVPEGDISPRSYAYRVRERERKAKRAKEW